MTTKKWRQLKRATKQPRPGRRKKQELGTLAGGAARKDRGPLVRPWGLKTGPKWGRDSLGAGRRLSLS